MLNALTALLSALAWPSVALIAIFLFRDSLKRFLERATEVGLSGIKALPPPQRSSKDAGSSTAIEIGDETPALREALREFDNRLVVEAEERVTKNLDEKKLQGVGREKFLLRNFVTLAIIQRFEHAWFYIWGSQLRALNALNSFKPNGMPKSALKEFYDEGRAAHPTFYTNYSFEDWFHFMETWELVRVDDGICRLTVAGEEFLKFLVHTGLTTNKAG